MLKQIGLVIQNTAGYICIWEGGLWWDRGNSRASDKTKRRSFMMFIKVCITGHLKTSSLKVDGHWTSVTVWMIFVCETFMFNVRCGFRTHLRKIIINVPYANVEFAVITKGENRHLPCFMFSCLPGMIEHSSRGLDVFMSCIADREWGHGALVVLKIILYFFIFI